MEGMDGVLRNIDALAQRMRKSAADAADESARYLESYAKTHKPYKDRTANLRNSTAGSWTMTPEGATVVISASMEYAPFVELGTRRNRPYAFLWPAVAENEAKIGGIFLRHMHL